MANAKQKNNQSGRSMVEMLGVLAIIGVLTVGGIIGYSYATDKHAANKIVDGANKFAVLCSAARQQNNTASCAGILAEMGLNTPPDNWTFTSDDLNGEFDVTIPDVRQKVCQAVTTLPWPIVLEMKSGEVSVGMDGVGCADNAPLTLAFANDLSIGESGEEGGGTPSCAPPCVHGTCNSAGTCVCDGLWTGAACDVCAGGAQGSTCCARLIDGVCCMRADATEVVDGQCCRYGYECCPSDSVGYSYGSWSCCASGDVLVPGAWGELACCPAGSTGYATYYDGGGCCTAMQVSVPRGDGYTICCPIGSPGYSSYWNQNRCCAPDEQVIPYSYWENVCCPIGSPGFSGYTGSCCAPGEQVFSIPMSSDNFCCPGDSPGFGGQQYRCCLATEVFITYTDMEGSSSTCCPAGSTGASDTGCY